MKRFSLLWVCGGLFLFAWDAIGQVVSSNRPPVIRHAPVKFAVPGQALGIRATVTTDQAAEPTVTLFYSVSKDAAPFRIKMGNSGAAIFLATIPGTVLSQVTNLSYYIEATDATGATSETPWNSVAVGVAAQVPTTTTVPPAAVAPPAGSAKDAPESRWWRNPWVWLGGAALAGGGIALAAGSGGGSSGDDSSGGGSAVTNAGTYVGSATECLQMGTAPPACQSRSIVLNISQLGIVSTENLQPGTRMETALSGASFTLAVSISETNLTGEIRYRGIVLDGRITGSIEGSAVAVSGTNGVYYGQFSAVRQ